LPVSRALVGVGPPQLMPFDASWHWTCIGFWMDNGFPSIQWWNEIGCGQEAGRGKDGAGSLVPWVDPPRLLDDVVEERQHPAVRQYAFHVVWSHVRQAHLGDERHRAAIAESRPLRGGRQIRPPAELCPADRDVRVAGGLRGKKDPWTAQACDP